MWFVSSAGLIILRGLFYDEKERTEDGSGATYVKCLYICAFLQFHHQLRLYKVQ